MQNNSQHFIDMNLRAGQPPGYNTTSNVYSATMRYKYSLHSICANRGTCRKWQATAVSMSCRTHLTKAKYGYASKRCVPLSFVGSCCESTDSVQFLPTLPVALRA